MAGRPCFGPCDPSIFEWIGYGGLLVAGVVVLLAIYAIARRNTSGRRLGTVVTAGIVLATSVALAVLIVPRYPRPVFHPAGITAGLDKSGRTDPFYLAGTYGVGWTLRPEADSACHFEAALYVVSDGRMILELVPSTVALSGEAPDTDRLPGAGYFIEATSECEWRISLTPRLTSE